MTPINILNYNYIYFKKSIFTTIKESLNKNIYRGNFVELARNISSSSIYLMTYNKLSSINNNNHFINGSISSMVMWSILYPLDTIKTKKFIENKSYIDIFKTTRLLNYYRGFSLVLLRTMPSSGMGMLIYENTKKYLSTEINDI